MPLATGAELALEQQGDWMTLPVFAAERRLTNMKAATLSQLCKVMKAPGASSLDTLQPPQQVRAVPSLGYREEM